MASTMDDANTQNLFGGPPDEDIPNISDPTPKGVVPESPAVPEAAAGSDEAHLDVRNDQPTNAQTNRGGYKTFAETNRYLMGTSYNHFFYVGVGCANNFIV